MRVPTFIGHDLDETTQLYIDVYVALEILHMRYPEYMRTTKPWERRLYQLFLAMKGQKDKHAQWHAEHDQKASEIAREAVNIDRRL